MISRVPIFCPGTRRTADHQTGDEHRDDRHDQHAVETGTGTTGRDLTQLHAQQVQPPPRPVLEEWKESTAPVEVSVVEIEKIAEAPMPSYSLPSIAPPAIWNAGPWWANSLHIIRAMKPTQMVAIVARIA